MEIMHNNKSSCLTRCLLVILPLMLLIFAAIPLLPTGLCVAALKNGTEAKQPTMELRVDVQNHARAFCNGMKAIVSIADFFEFYVKNLDGSRKRICAGPWQGSLKENFTGTYILKGNDPASGAEYTIVVKQVNSDTIELYMTFKAPNQKCNLGFDIAKLAGDMFKAASIDARPAALSDVKVIPYEPMPVAKRMLFKYKNRVLLKSTLCDLEIKDLAETGTMLAADSRSIPWDNTKSIYFGAETSDLNPGESYSFRYSIRFLPPSQPLAKQNADVSAISKNPLCIASTWTSANSWLFYSIPPKEESKTSGRFLIESSAAIYGVPTASAETVLARELAKLTSLQLEVKQSGSSAGVKGIYLERIPKGADKGLPAEGFEIITTPTKIIVRGADERGSLFGIYALMSRLVNVSGTWGIDCGTIRDWPDLPIRGICMEQLSPGIRDDAIIKRYLDAFSRARGNVVVFLHDSKQMRAWLRSRDDGGWTKEQMSEIADYARSLHMDVWGGMGSRFKPGDFPEMDINKGAQLYNPSSESNYQYLFSLYDEILKAYHPATMLISHDEIIGLSSYAALMGKSTAEILAADVIKIHEKFARDNVRTAMWSDMLLDYKVWDTKVGAANSSNPYFNSGATHLALPYLPKDILVLDWHYGEKNDYASIDYFHRSGFSVAGAPWYDPVAAKGLAVSAKKYGGQGVVTTDWGFLRTFSPAATTLYAPMCAWSTNCQLDQNNNDVAALAGTVRDEIFRDRSFRQIKINLESVSNKSMVDESGGSTIFGVGPFLDLREFSAGLQTFDGITFDVASGNRNHPENCVVVGKVDDQTSQVPLDRSVYRGALKTRAIAFLQTCLVEEPQYNLRKLGRYVVEYDNGTSETLDLLENWNITDVRSSEGLRHNSWSFNRSPDVLIGSKLAWRGNSASGIPLNVQLFIWKNPYPDLKIQSIRLSAAGAPENSKIALLGLTFLQ